MMFLKEGGLYTDGKYGTELVVEYIDELVVMAEEKKSGHNNIYRREDFTDQNPRFVKNDKS